MTKSFEERRDNLQDIIYESESVVMCSWSSMDYLIELDDLHPCGNTACIGGHLALSPMFQAEGGGIDVGAPIFMGYYGATAVATYLGTDPKATELVILSVEGDYGVVGWDQWKSREAYLALMFLYCYDGDLAKLCDNLSNLIEVKE